MWLLLIGLLLVSCEKEELPISPHTPGPEQIAQISMGADYGKQIFYRLSDHTVVNQNPKTAWDIGFQCGEDGWRITLNSARGGAAALVETNDFSSVNSSNGVSWNWDAQSGNPDSTAIGDYRNADHVILIDRGYDPQGNHTGYRKMKVMEVNETAYSIRLAELNGANDIKRTIEKSESKSYLAFSFDANNVVQIAPDKTQWDLLFTQYVHLFHNPLTPYLVTGVLINRYETTVAEVTDRVFEEIKLEHVQQYEFNSELDIIGYDWKTYSFESASYTVNPDISYILRNAEGRHFKLHFIDFYNDIGERGAPKFEMQEL